MENMIWNIFCYFFLFFIASVFGSTTPVGHLEPLGNQRPPSVDIIELFPETAPRPQQFYDYFVKPSTAAIFRNAMGNSKAFKLWTDEYLKSNYGDLEVRLEGKKEKIHSTPIGEKYMGRDTIGHFIDNYHLPNSSTYIVSELPRQMYKDFGVLPSFGACGGMVKSMVEMDLWWSGGGSKSVIHKDAFNQINCLLRGTKYWKLFEFKYEKWLYKHEEGPNEVGGYSEVNVDAVDLKKHPNFAKVPWSNFTMYAGDCLFLPKSYYHQVDSDGPFNLAVSILFSRFDHISPGSFDDCTTSTDYLVPRPLSDFDVMWQWNGSGVMSMGCGDLEESYRFLLYSRAKALEKRGKAVTVDTLISVFHGTAGDGRTSNSNFSHAMSAIDTNNDNLMSSKEIKAASFDQLRRFGVIVEPYEPSNNYDFEYSFVSYKDVYRALKQILSTQDVVTRNDWVRAYQSNCYGTREFAQEIFTGLAQSNDTNVVVSKNITEADLGRALIKWKQYWAPQYSDGNNPNTADSDDEDDDDNHDDDEQDDRGAEDDNDKDDGDDTENKTKESVTGSSDRKEEL